MIEGKNGYDLFGDDNICPLVDVGFPHMPYTILFDTSFEVDHVASMDQEEKAPINNCVYKNKCNRQPIGCER